MGMKSVSNITNLKSISDLYNEVARIHGVTPELVNEIEKHNFRYVYHKIRKQEAVEILFHNFGTFYTNLKFVNKRIRNIMTSYRKGNLERERLVEELTVLWKERQKLIKLESN